MTKDLPGQAFTKASMAVYGNRMSLMAMSKSARLATSGAWKDDLSAFKISLKLRLKVKPAA